jgi:hypothetical protein
MNDSQDLDQILQRRFIPSPASNLASRIIEAAREPKKKRRFYLVQEIFQMMEIPRPAYALAVCLVIGLVLGIQIDNAVNISEQDLLSFVEIDDDWLL